MIIWHHSDGSVAVTRLVPQARETEVEHAERLRPFHPDATMSIVPDTAPVPSRRFRNAWTFTGSAIAVDMARARVQRLTEIRAERDTRLAASDGLLFRAQEAQPATAPAWLAYRQALRDLPATVSMALTTIAAPDALAVYVPAWPAFPAA